jgi:tetracycline resistance efflux pump
MLEPATRLGVSREKLAYVVDSTSSAVACVAIMSTWIAYQLSMIREGIHAAGFEVSEGKSFTLFLSSIPYNFYCWFTLLLLALVIWRDWNIGPMCKAEQIAQSRQERSDEKTGNGSTPPPSNLAAAAVPLVVLLGGLFVGLYWDGTAGQVFPLSPGRVAEAFGKADAALVMLCASTLAALVAAGMNHRSIRESGASTSGVFMEGVQQLLSPVLILVSAWIFSSTLKQLGTVSVLTTLLDGTLPLWALPFLVFLLGAAISFTTGTSWGTMGVLMPLALPVAIQLSGGVDGMVVLGVIAAVFSGAVFGDHCSPLSDTTIVASISCAVEPMEHVRTQLPYALIAAGLTIVAGFLPTGLGIHPVLALGAGFLCLLLITRFCRTAKVTL